MKKSEKSGEKKDIRHPGTVTEVTPDYITVKFLTESACAGCHARGVCGASDSEEGSIQVRNRLGYDYAEGDKVDIVLKRYLGMKAVGICYGIPLVILLVLLLYLPNVTENEVVQGVVCLAFVALYYLGIRIFRDKIEKSYEFVIESGNN
ncbi:MAG: SoxR reducing system RseC family protein [Alistipes sp.]|nr:SoxR reducing system RseC family protein [Candidatus Minthomonas equi]